MTFLSGQVHLIIQISLAEINELDLMTFLSGQVHLIIQISLAEINDLDLWDIYRNR